MDPQAERKKLIQKQQNEIKAMEKDVKKKKVFFKICLLNFIYLFIHLTPELQ